MKIDLMRDEDKVLLRLASQNHEEQQQLRLFANSFIDDPTAARYEAPHLYLTVIGVDTDQKYPAPAYEPKNAIVVCPKCQTSLDVTVSPEGSTVEILGGDRPGDESGHDKSQSDDDIHPAPTGNGQPAREATETGSPGELSQRDPNQPPESSDQGTAEPSPSSGN